VGSASLGAFMAEDSLQEELATSWLRGRRNLQQPGATVTPAAATAAQEAGSSDEVSCRALLGKWVGLSPCSICTINALYAPTLRSGGLWRPAPYCECLQGGDEDEGAESWQPACEVCGRRYPHEHIRSTFVSRAEDSSDEEA
jgi:hypothetical protein